MSSIGDRIKELRTKLELSQDVFAAKLGYTRGKITNIEVNGREPEDLLINLICSVYNVNEQWLRSGDGPMFGSEDKERETIIANLVNTYLSSDSESFKSKFITMLSRLTEEQWEVLALMHQNIEKKD